MTCRLAAYNSVRDSDRANLIESVRLGSIVPEAEAVEHEQTAADPLGDVQPPGSLLVEADRPRAAQSAGHRHGHGCGAGQ